jgi:putative transposase
MLLCKKIKLNVIEQDAATLEFMQAKCRGLHNWWVMRLRDGEKWPGWEEAKKALQASKEHDPELRYVYGKCLQEVYFRLDGSMKAFFRRVKHGEKPGFPRVRPRHCFFTLIYPAMYIKVENILTRFLARLGPYTHIECDVLQDTWLDVASMGLAQAGEVQKLTM